MPNELVNLINFKIQLESRVSGNTKALKEALNAVLNVATGKASQNLRHCFWGMEKDVRTKLLPNLLERLRICTIGFPFIIFASDFWNCILCSVS